MDSRDYLDDDGWPEIAPRDRLPLLWLCKGAATTSQFTQRAVAVMDNSTSRTGIGRLNEEREAVAYALTLPGWWHCCPVRSHRCSEKPRPPPEPPRPIFRGAFGMGTFQTERPKKK